MIVELTKLRKILYAIAACLFPLIGMAEMAINPAIYGIMETYGYDFIGSYVVSAPTLWTAIGALCCGFALKKFTKKQLLVFAATVFTIFGFFATAFTEVAWFALSRSVMGFTEGIINTLMAAYIVQMYMDDKGRAAFMSIYNLFYCLIGAGLSAAGGFLSVPVWQNAFTIYALGVLVVLLAVFFLPEIDRADKLSAAGREYLAAEQAKQENMDASAGKSEGFGRIFWLSLAAWFISMVMCGFFFYFASELLEETGVGDSSVTGLVFTANSLIGLLSSVVLTPLWLRTKKWMGAIGIALEVLGFSFFLTMSGSLVGAYIAALLIGFGMGFYYPGFYMIVADVTPLAKNDMAISLAGSVYSLAYFLVSYLVNFLRPILDPDFQMVINQLPVFFVIGLIGLGVELLSNVGYKQYKQAHADVPAQEA